MSTATQAAPDAIAAETEVGHDGHGEHEGPEHDGPEPHGQEHGLSDFGYIKVALLLGVLTAAEVLTYFVDTGPVEVPALLILMVVKFEIVVAYFMHLRFDNRLFTWLFVGGLVLAVAVYAAMGTSMLFWTDPAGCELSPNPNC
ncbi:cytochrome C oxidase subunit IV family protein [Candidatus Poriferisodalis sp.]|uniref:cytochrome C oxidase subunit IV family protein n=1 Tax=Candidatus Poriferisodalis sp. TaxID=3101277 RepID=UPI003B01813F